MHTLIIDEADKFC